MKLWKKLFFVLFVLVLFSFNLGCSLIIHMIYNISFHTQKEAIISEAGYSGDQIYSDLAPLASHNQLFENNLRNCLWTYAEMLRKRDVYLNYEVAGISVYNSLPKLQLDKLDWSKGEITDVTGAKQEVLTFSRDGKDYVAVREHYDGSLEGHAFTYAYSLENFRKEWKRVWKIIPIIECIIILMVGVLLCIILLKLTRPLKKLSEVTKKVAAGEKGERVIVRGNDEVTLLAKNFNFMIAKIEDSISKLEEAAGQKQRFIDNLGHEIRTPLTSISGYAEYLKMAQVSEEDRLRALGYITSEGHRLEKLSNTLLDLAMFREDEIKMEKLQVADLLELMQIGFRIPFEKKKLTLETYGETEEMYGNFELLCSLMVNLIENASRACQEGGRVAVTIKKGVDSPGSTVMQVEDNGIGIQKNDIDKVVEPFYRVDKARSRDMGGVGLGVTLCQQIVQAHGGTMKYESESGKGTRVTVILNKFTT